MDRKIKIEKRMEIEKALGTTGNPKKKDVIRSLKGYSEFTEEIENMLFEKDLENDWLLLGRLIINKTKLDKIKDAAFLKDSNNYFIIKTEDNVNEFFEYANSIHLKNTPDKIEKKSNKSIDNFYEISNFSPDIIDKKLIDEFFNFKDNYAQCSSLNALIKILEANEEMKKSDLYKGLCITAKKAGICLYRYELFEHFKGDKVPIEKIERATDNSIQKIKEKKIEDQNKLFDKINEL